MNNKILNLQKQNDAIYSSLISKNITFERKIIPSIDSESEDAIFTILMEENKELKELSKNNKPPQQISDKNVLNKNDDANKKKEQIPKAKSDEKDKDSKEEEEETYEDKKSFPIIHNMEDIKRAFFNREYDMFENLIKEHPFIYYNAKYKYSSDNDGKPDYVARNLLKGFNRSLDDYRKYVMVCFRCIELEDRKYEYQSLWIVNTNENLNSVIGSIYDDFDFQIVENTEKTTFLTEFRKKDDNIFAETYVH